MSAIAIIFLGLLAGWLLIVVLLLATAVLVVTRGAVRKVRAQLRRRSARPPLDRIPLQGGPLPVRPRFTRIPGTDLYAVAEDLPPIDPYTVRALHDEGRAICRAAAEAGER